MIKSFYKKFAFTLTEVLIALAIVGVIAGMVLPAIVNKFHTDSLSRSEKRMKQTLETAVKGLLVTENKNDTTQTMLYVNNDNASSYANSSMAFMKKYLKISRTCTASNITTECFAPRYYDYAANNRRVNYTPSYSQKYKSACATLKNGAAICMKPGTPSSKPIEVLVDLNGRKGPNVKGRDLVEFSISQISSRVRSTSIEKIEDEQIVIAILQECNPSQGTYDITTCCTDTSTFIKDQCCYSGSPYESTPACQLTPPNSCDLSPTPDCCKDSTWRESNTLNSDYCCSVKNIYCPLTPVDPPVTRSGKLTWYSPLVDNQWSGGNKDSFKNDFMLKSNGDLQWDYKVIMTVGYNPIYQQASGSTGSGSGIPIDCMCTVENCQYLRFYKNGGTTEGYGCCVPYYNRQYNEIKLDDSSAYAESPCANVDDPWIDVSCSVLQSKDSVEYTTIWAASGYDECIGSFEVSVTEQD